MSEELKNTENTENTEFSLDDLGAELGFAGGEVTIEEEEVVLAEDLDGFAKGFPDWDLLPPRK